MDLGIPPLKFKNLLESNPLRSTSFVCGLAILVLLKQIVNVKANISSMLKGGIPTPIGNLPEIVSQPFSVRGFLVYGLTTQT